MNKIRVAQIGTSANSHGSDIWCSFLKNSDLFEVVGYAFPENEREKFPQRTAVFDGYREMTVDEILSDPEIAAVAVETEEMYLTKYALMVARAGKHLHMEKPGSQDLSSFEDLISEVKKNGKAFHLGYMYRYNPYVTELLSQVKNGELGDIISVEAQMNCIHPDHIRQWLSNFKGGMMFFLGCHLIDLILKIKGKPERITAYNRSSGLNGTTAEDFGMAVLEYKNGVSFAKTVSCEISGFERRQLVVTGTKKTVELKPLEWHSPDGWGQSTYKTEYASSGWWESGEKSVSEAHDRYDTMMRAFASYCRGERTNPDTPDSELELFRTVLTACGMNSVEPYVCLLTHETKDNEVYFNGN